MMWGNAYLEAPQHRLIIMTAQLFPPHLLPIHCIPPTLMVLLHYTRLMVSQFRDIMQHTLEILVAVDGLEHCDWWLRHHCNEYMLTYYTDIKQWTCKQEKERQFTHIQIQGLELFSLILVLYSILYYYYCIWLYFLFMRPISNATVDIENDAKNTLAYFSEFQENCYDWHSNIITDYSRKRHYRILDPIKKKKFKQERSCSSNGNAFVKSRKPLVPCKVSLENQVQKIRKSFKVQARQPSLGTTAKENFRPHKTIRNAYSLTRQAEEKEEEHGFDFMQYWIKHRFEDGAINVLVEKLKEKGHCTMLRL